MGRGRQECLPYGGCGGAAGRGHPARQPGKRRANLPPNQKIFRGALVDLNFLVYSDGFAA